MSTLNNGPVSAFYSYYFSLLADDDDNEDTEERRLRDRGELSAVHCDFQNLEVGIPLADVHQADVLQSECRLSVTGTNPDGRGSRPVTVVEMMLSKTDNDNASPTASSTTPSSTIVEESQKGLTLLPERNSWRLTNNDAKKEDGGCLYIDFVDPVFLTGLELQLRNVSSADPTTIAVS